MFYVIYPELWKLLIKNENFVIVEQGGGGPFDVSGGPFVVLEILEKNSEFGNFFPKFWKFENFQNFELKFPKSEANFDAGRGIWVEISKVGSKFWRWEGYISQNFQNHRGAATEIKGAAASLLVNSKISSLYRELPKFGVYNIKHNLARSCFQFWPSKSAPRVTKFWEKNCLG